MDAASGHTTVLWPLVAYALAVVALVGFMVGFSYVLGERHKERTTGDPYESGMITTGSARLRFPVHFYVVAMFFVIFDLEAVFIVAWAVSINEVGWTGYFGALIFIGILVIVLIYEWSIGALDYALKGKDILKKYKTLNKTKIKI